MSEPEQKKRGPKGNKDRFQLVIPTELLEEARQLSNVENRSLSNMLATLVAEAIRGRKERQPAG